MNDEKDTYQQQILFSEPNDLSKLKFESELESDKQVILPEAAWQPVDDVFEEANDIEAKPSKPRWLWRIAGLSFVGILGYEAVNFFINGFNSSPIITSIYGVLFAAIAGISSLALIKEISGLIQFKRQIKTHTKAELLLKNEITLDAIPFCKKISDNLPSDTIHEQQDIWLKAIDDQLSDQEVLSLYSKMVLHKVDEQALSQVAKFSTEAVMLVAISPVAIIDMLVLMWRNLRMIDKIAGLYGIRLGYWSRIKLIKQVFTNMVYAGASEIIADVGLEMLGIDTLGRLSTRAAQGLGAGMLTARLGIKTIKLCRPVPFTEKTPGIGQVRQEVISQVKSLLTKK